MRKWFAVALILGLFASVPLAWFHEPLLTNIGQWLIVERPVEKVDLVVALGGDRRRQEEAVRLLHQGVAQWIAFLMDMLDRVYFPHSLGLLYLAITQYLGFPKYGDEYKVMGLAPYGSPDFVSQIRQLVHLKPSGSFALDLSYFSHWSEGAAMTWDEGEPTVGPVFTHKLAELLGPARQTGDPVASRHEAIAASLQVVFEEATCHILNALYQRTRVSRLCLAGGCAMNSVMNGKIRERTPFQEVYIQPAAGDNGTALGAALYAYHQLLNKPRHFVMEHGYWGPGFSDEDICRELGEQGAGSRKQGAESGKQKAESREPGTRSYE